MLPKEFEETLEPDFLDRLNELLQNAHERKTDDSAPSDNRRRWSIVYTDLEKIKAYVVQYLFGGGSE